MEQMTGVEATGNMGRGVSRTIRARYRSDAGTVKLIERRLTVDVACRAGANAAS